MKSGIEARTIIGACIERVKQVLRAIAMLGGPIEWVASNCWRRTTLMNFEVSLAEHCNLNCVGCSHFSPLAEPILADFDEVSRDFQRMSQLLKGKVQYIHLMGGEPLLHPDLIRFLGMARGCFSKGEIDLVTNGLGLLNQPEEFWRACRKHGITITPTKYPIPLDYDQIEKRAEKYGVAFRYYDGGKATKTMLRYAYDLEGKQNCRSSFVHCYMGVGCFQLYHGRLYPCASIPYSRHFSEYFGKKLEISPEDSIDIYQVQSQWEIRRFLARPVPFCRYCMPEKIQKHLPWRKSERIIDEWTRL